MSGKGRKNTILDKIKARKEKITNKIPVSLDMPTTPEDVRLACCAFYEDGERFPEVQSAIDRFITTVWLRLKSQGISDPKALGSLKDIVHLGFSLLIKHFPNSGGAEGRRSFYHHFVCRAAPSDEYGSPLLAMCLEDLVFLKKALDQLKTADEASTEIVTFHAQKLRRDIAKKLEKPLGGSPLEEYSKRVSRYANLVRDGWSRLVSYEELQKPPEQKGAEETTEPAQSEAHAQSKEVSA